MSFNKTIFLFFLITVGIPYFPSAQTSKTFKARLIDYSSNKLPGECGYFAYATTLKFQLAENVDTLKKGQTILLKIPCPREKGIKLYKNNSEYDITAFGNSEEDKKTIQNSWTMFYKYENENLPEIWCKYLKMIE